MKEKPGLDFVYILVVIGVIYFLFVNKDLSSQSLLLHLAFFDIVVGFVLIIKGFIKWEMSYIVTGAFCALCSFYAYKEMSDAALFFLILGGIVGVGNHVRKTLKKFIG